MQRVKAICHWRFRPTVRREHPHGVVRSDAPSRLSHRVPELTAFDGEEIAAAARYSVMAPENAMGMTKKKTQSMIVIAANTTIRNQAITVESPRIWRA